MTLPLLNRAARAQIAAVLRHWTDSLTRYTDVPETFAEIISQYANDTPRPKRLEEERRPIAPARRWPS